MSIPLEELLADFSCENGTDEQSIHQNEKILGIVFPPDFVQFLKKYNGGEGFIGNHYLTVWKVDELSQFNAGYQVPKYAPGLVLFGSTGGGEGFAFDTRKTPYPIVQVPFVGMDLEYAIPVADSFSGLLEGMINTDESLL